MCQDGAWVDPQGGPGLIALQCVACTRATPRADSSSLRDFMAASQQERWWLQRHPVEIRSWDNLCLTSDSASNTGVTISFTDPVEVPTSSRRRRDMDSGESYGSVTWGGSSSYKYGWTGDGGHCVFNQRTEVVGGFKSFSIAGNQEKKEDLPGFLQGMQYTVSFKVKALPSVSSGVSVHWSSNTQSCDGSSCPAKKSCPSGRTLVKCEAVTDIAPSNKDPLGVQVTSGGECRAYGATGLGADVRVGNEKSKPRGDAWSDYATCGASGYVAVTPARMWAGINYDGAGRRRRNSWDLNLISNKADSEKTSICPEGTWLKKMDVCSGSKWDGVFSGVCTDGTTMNTKNEACGGRRRRGARRRNNQMDRASGARRVYGQAGSNADKVCIHGGHCQGTHNSNYFDYTCGDNGLLAGFKEYERRRSIKFSCREMRPVVKAFDCTDSGCRALCANDDCKIKPFCVKAHTNSVESGTEKTSSGPGAWTDWATCPTGFKAVGLRYMELIGSLVDADVTSLSGLECGDDGCRAKSPRTRVKIRPACMRHTSMAFGTKTEKTGTGWSPVSGCPSGYNPMGVAKAYMHGNWDTMRIWECDTSGCKIYCVGTQKCEIVTACISAKTTVRLDCSTDHRNLIVRTSTGTGTRTPSSCPSTHHSARCLCYSATQGKCSPSRRRYVGQSGCSVNFGTSSGRVTRLCTQGTGSIRTYLGSQASHIYEDLTAAPVTKSHSFTAQGSGKLQLRVRGLAPSGVTLHVSDLKIVDSTTTLADQSLLIDLENKCSGSRWEVQLPATPEGTPYLVTVTYGDKRAAIQTSACSIGTSGQMVGAKASPETVSKGSTKSVTRTVFVKGNSDGRGNLVFAGESAGGCTGVRSISAQREDSVFWASCGTPFSQVWNLAASKQAPGNIQLVHRGRAASGSGALACVDPATGKMATCAHSVEEHVKQVFSMDYLAPLVAQWTQFESGQNLQQGSCVRAHAKYLPNLDINSNLVSCGTGQVLSSFLFRQDSTCNHVDYYRYFYTCTTIIPVTGIASCSQKSTRCVAHSSPAKPIPTSGSSIATMSALTVKQEHCSPSSPTPTAPATMVMDTSTPTLAAPSKVWATARKSTPNGAKWGH
ncbi:unnamed protein product [Symbiodinium natans]|uniref:Uncharacterized protein n=1 Tax=Symbiodinium natans TaxID=878477 RepID=A0A812QKN1_9DINO|nr:unnamed protein product [Symbiodinium natans]